MTAAVDARGLTVALDGRRVVDAVDLTVARGEWVGIIGPNGAGKTTLLRAIAGLVSASGAVEILGREVTQLGARTRAKRVAYVPQRPTIPSGVTVTDYVLLGRTPHLGILAVERRRDLDVVAATLAALDLEELAHRDLSTLSGGELQRVVLARALAQEAPLLLLDEPTTALDVGRQQEVLELVEGLRRERDLTVLTALHDLTLAGQFSDRLVLVVEGRVVSAGDRRQVLTPQLIARHYGATVRVVDDGDGGIVVVPVRRNGEAAAG